MVEDHYEWGCKIHFGLTTKGFQRHNPNSYTVDFKF